MMRAEQAHDNLSRLSLNPYPGCGLIVGVDNSGKNLIQVYWIMGRSESSRNRVFKSEGSRVFTDFIDASKVGGDPSLLIYNAMCEVRGECIVSNGDHTTTIFDALRNDRSFYSAMRSREHEPDRPNYTPRIAAVSRSSGAPETEIGIILKVEGQDEGLCERKIWSYDFIPPGYGYCIHTYDDDGDPLPSFVGEPFLVPLDGGLRELAEWWWGVLNEDNEVSLVAKMIPLEHAPSQVYIINK